MNNSCSFGCLVSIFVSLRVLLGKRLKVFCTQSKKSMQCVGVECIAQQQSVLPHPISWFMMFGVGLLSTLMCYLQQTTPCQGKVTDITCVDPIVLPQTDC